jgi:hypothetical protein
MRNNESKKLKFEKKKNFWRKKLRIKSKEKEKAKIKKKEKNRDWKNMYLVIFIQFIKNLLKF